MKRLCLVILLFSVCFSYGQNLVPNPSFEEHAKCPKEYSDVQKGYVKHWFQPTKGTSDYFNACGGKKSMVGVPKNNMGICNARTGNAYVGSYFYYNYDEYREYISAKLKSPLVAGKTYKVQFFVSLARISEYGTSNFQVLFTTDSIYKKVESRLRYEPQLTYADSPVVAVEKWTKISWTYTAKGNEQYITIGNFEKDKKTVLKKAEQRMERQNGGTYYYIDDVCISEIRSDGNCTCDSLPKKDTLIMKVVSADTSTKPKLSIETNKSIVLQNISFETNKSQLLPPSYPELDELYNYLNTHPSTSIEISGYTDNTGDEQKNITLSEARAKAVADYLTSKGIDKSRISYKGYGSANPIADNKTEEGKAKNRRVEFKIH